MTVTRILSNPHRSANPARFHVVRTPHLLGSLLLAGLAWGQPCLAAVPAAERQALIDFYNATGGDNWINNGGTISGNTWQGAVGDPCAWTGVTCSASHVTQLFLTQNNLSGSMTAAMNALVNLPNLRYINFYGNNLSGSIPSMTGFTKLDTFYVDHNAISGVLPMPGPMLTSLSSARVCPNPLTLTSDGALNSAWNLATGMSTNQYPLGWYTDCDPVFYNGFEAGP